MLFWMLLVLIDAGFYMKNIFLQSIICWIIY